MGKKAYLFLTEVLSLHMGFPTSYERHHTRLTLFYALGAKSFSHYTEAPVKQDRYMILNSINCFVNEIRGQQPNG